jgi:hypothetical protein
MSCSDFLVKYSKSKTEITPSKMGRSKCEWVSDCV